MKKHRVSSFVFSLVVLFMVFSVVSTDLMAQDKREGSKEEVAQEIIFGFEEGVNGWDIPDWAQNSEDHVADQIKMSSKYAKSGESSMEVSAEFPGEKWTGAYLEYVGHFDWTDYTQVALDIYIPEGTPSGLTGKIILAVGEDWEWTEMRRPVRLEAGKWVTVDADLMPGTTDWKKKIPDQDFRTNVKKLGLRVESDKKPKYKGSFYIDNVRLTVGNAKSKTKKLVSEEVVLDFEQDIEKWKIPEWVEGSDNYVAEEIVQSSDYAKEGKNSLEIISDFPGGVWTAAYIEYTEDFDWTDSNEIRADIYIPEDAPAGLMGKIILAVGEGWKWTEMKRPVRLVAGEWVTVKANLMPGNTDWKETTPDDEFRANIKKIGVRVESDKKPKYKGSFYVDNVRTAVLEN
ncbi:MAG: hypothetical protein ABH868_07160 [bacterium]